jgi:hypothetical protein
VISWSERRDRSPSRTCASARSRERRACDVDAAELDAAGEAQRRDLLAADTQGHDHRPLCRRRRRVRAGRQQLRARVEQRLGLAAQMLEDRLRLRLGRDVADRRDERLEELRLLVELVLGLLVPRALGLQEVEDDQHAREAGEPDAHERGRRAVDEQGDHRPADGEREPDDESPGASR